MATAGPGIAARVGMRVEVIGKNLVGTVSYVGMTAFAAGKWIGVALDDPKGKNDGTVQGKKYFECPPNHGIFVRQTQLSELKEEFKVETADRQPSKPTGIIPPSVSGASKIGGLRKPGFSTTPKTEQESQQVKTAVPSPRGSGLKQPTTGIAKRSQSPAARSPSPAQSSGLKKPGTISPATSSTGISQIGGHKKSISPSNSMSGITKTSAKPNADTPSGLQRPQAKTSGLQRPQQSGLQRPQASSPAIKKPLGGLSKSPATPSGLQKPAPVTQSTPQPPQETSTQETVASTPQVESDETKDVKVESKVEQPLLPAHKVIAVSEEVSDLQRKLLEKERAVVDLEEKLNAIKLKRQQDLTKLKDVEKLRMQNEQFIEYKAKWQESQRDLQNQLRQAQNDAREAADKISSEGDIGELQEAVEMATLDKEMAEEKYESLVQEHDQLKENYEEVQLELEILKNEISEGGVETVAATAHSKQIEQQNERLKEALVKLKDIAQNDKMELAQAQRVNKELNQKLSSIGTERDKLQERLQQAELQIDELKEQVDFALGAEEMVEKLTDKNLELEEKIEQHEETIQDLEALRELNEELEESHVQTEHDLREELDMADNKIRELERQITAQIEQATDYQETIVKFRQLVQSLQGRIKDLHGQSVESIPDEELDTTPVPEIDFKTKFAEAKQYGRIIELELNKYHVQEANKKIEMINNFLPEHFTKRGADYDGLCLLLLLERLQFKCKLLATQLHDKHGVLELVDGGQPVDGVKGDQASYACLLAYQLANFHTIVSQYSRALNECDVATFIRISGQYPELAVHEKIIDNYIELLRNDMLDDTVSLEVLEKTINLYQNFYKLQLSSAPRDCTEFLADTLMMVTNGSDAVSVDILRMKAISQNCEEGSTFLNLLSFIELKNMEIKQLCRKVMELHRNRRIKRRMIQDSSTTLSYPDSVTTELIEAVAEQVMTVRYTQDLASVLSLKYSQLTDGESLLSGHLDEASQDCVTLVYEKEDEAIDVLSASYSKILSCLSGIAIKLPEGEYDTEPEEKPTPAYLERATVFKDELSSTTKLEARIDQKQHELNELKKVIKVKTDELSEANIRIGLLDKRADNAAKEAGTKVDQMTKKYEQLQTEFREKTKQSEKTMDALQSDIDSLETENTDMKKKLELYGKKSNLDFARLSQTSAAMSGIVSPGKPGSAMASLAKAGVAGASQVQVVLQDSPIFLAQLENQKKALQYLQKENWALKCQKWKSELAELPTQYSPKLLWRDGKFINNPNITCNKEEKEGKLTSQNVMKECKTLFKNLNDLAVFPKMVDITRKKTDDNKFKPSPEEQIVHHKVIMNKLQKQKEELSKKVETVIAQELPGARVKSTLRDFLSPEYSRLRQENEKPIHIATLNVPKKHALVKDGVRNICVTPQEFTKIHALIANG